MSRMYNSSNLVKIALAGSITVVQIQMLEQQPYVMDVVTMIAPALRHQQISNIQGDASNKQINTIFGTVDKQIIQKRYVQN